MSRRGGLYVLELSNGALKLGATGSIMTRAKHLAACEKCSVVRWAWVGNVNGCMLDAEKWLLADARKHFPSMRGREWFCSRAGDFDVAVRLLVAQVLRVGIVPHKTLAPAMCGGIDEWPRRELLRRQLREMVAA